MPVILVLAPIVMVLANHGSGDGGPGGPSACEDKVKKV